MANPGNPGQVNGSGAAFEAEYWKAPAKSHEAHPNSEFEGPFGAPQSATDQSDRGQDNRSSTASRPVDGPVGGRASRIEGPVARVLAQLQNSRAAQSMDDTVMEGIAAVSAAESRALRGLDPSQEPTHGSSRSMRDGVGRDGTERGGVASGVQNTSLDQDTVMTDALPSIGSPDVDPASIGAPASVTPRHLESSDD